MWLPLGVGNVVCVNGVVYVWSDLFQSVSSPPFSGMLMKTGSLHPWLGCGHVHDLMILHTRLYSYTQLQCHRQIC